MSCLLRNRRQATVRSSSARRASLSVSALETRQLLSTAPSYLVPRAPGVDLTPIITVGEAAGNGYRMVGLPDGLGAYDNGNGTFTVLMNHEIRPDRGAVRAHGSTGAFVSKWVIDKATLNVISGSDLITNVALYDPAVSGSYTFGTTAFNRLCSADLPAISAFAYDPTPERPNSGDEVGTTERIFMNGEETTGGRAFGTVVTGPYAGIAYELPYLGKFAWENSVASPYPQAKTIVMGLDDSDRVFSSEGATQPSEVYVYIGQKTRSANPVVAAGLSGGTLYGVRVINADGTVDLNESTVTGGERFQLASLGNAATKTAAQLQADSIANQVTQFRRVEDGTWIPNPEKANEFYFVTTDRFRTATQSGNSRLWRLTFDDITQPELGGRIDIVVDTQSLGYGQMFDNITADAAGNILLQEDPGNQAHLAKIYQYSASSGQLIEIAEFDPALFQPGAPGFLTQDEEASGIIDVSSILGPGHFLTTAQAHYAIPGELVEGGQLLVLNTNAPRATLDASGSLVVEATINDDSIEVARVGSDFQVRVNGMDLGTHPRKAVMRLRIDGSYGDDTIIVAPTVNRPAILLGGDGNDYIQAGNAASLLIGGSGADVLIGGTKSDLLIAGKTAYDSDPDVLDALLDIWSSNRSYASRVNGVAPLLNASTIEDDLAIDFLVGGEGLDLFFVGRRGRVIDRKPGEIIRS